MEPSAYADIDGDGDAELFSRWMYRGRTFEGDSAGMVRQYGFGSPGSGGVIPVLGAKGPFRVGEEIEIRLTGGRGGSTCQLTIGFSESALANSPFPGASEYNAPWFRRLPFHLGGANGMPGEGGFTLSTTIPPSFAGLTFFHQAYVADPGAPFGWSSTCGLEIRYR